LEIPEFFELDISDLALNASMHISDLKIPEGSKLITNAGETVATCAVIAEEVFAAPTAAPAEGEAAAAGAAAAPGAAAPAGGAAAPAAGAAAPAAGAAKK
jgi:large subunit ribosomal protein L25